MFEKIKNWFKKEKPTPEEKPIPGTSEYYHEVEVPEWEELASKTMINVNVEKEISCGEIILSRETKTYFISQLDFDMKRNFDGLEPESVDEKVFFPNMVNYPEHLRKTTISTFDNAQNFCNEVEKYIKDGARVVIEKSYSGTELTSNHKTEYKPYGNTLVVKNYSHGDISSVKNYDIKDQVVDLTKDIELSKYRELGSSEVELRNRVSQLENQESENNKLKQQLESKDSQITDLLEKIKVLEGKERLLENPLVQETLKEAFKEYTSEKIVLEKVENYSKDFENGDSETGTITTTETYNLPGKFKEKVILTEGELFCADGHNTGTYRYDTHSLETEKYNEKGNLTYSSYSDHLDRSSEKFYKNGTLERVVEKEGESPNFNEFKEVQYIGNDIQSALKYVKGMFREELTTESGDLQRVCFKNNYNGHLTVTKEKGGEITSRRTYDIKDKNIDFTKSIDLTKLKRIDKKKNLSKGMER